MNTTYALWRELWIIAQQPGGWVLLLALIFSIAFGVWALLNRAWPYTITLTHERPTVRINEELARELRHLRQFDAFKQPTLTGAAPKGFSKSPRPSNSNRALEAPAGKGVMHASR